MGQRFKLRSTSPMSLLIYFPTWLLVLAFGCVALRRIIQRATLISGLGIKEKLRTRNVWHLLGCPKSALEQTQPVTDPRTTQLLTTKQSSSRTAHPIIGPSLCWVNGIPPCVTNPTISLKSL